MKSPKSGIPPPEALLRAIVDFSEDAIVSTDIDSIVTSWNWSAERIFGYSASEMIGRSITVLVPPGQVDEEEAILNKTRTGERVDHFETVRRRKDGRLIDVVVSISPIHSLDGGIVGASNVTRDISENKREALADQHLAAIVNSSDDAIISKSLDGIITSWNVGAERIFGYTAEEIVGQSVLKLIPDDRKDEEPKILERLRGGQRVDHFETVRVRKTGETVDVSLCISPVKNAKGEIVGASKVARDITAAKRTMRERDMLLESERLARSQAEEANHLKDEFLSTVSHELRTPLNAIVGWADVLADGGKDRQDVIEGVNVIKSNAMMQAQLIDDLLDLGRITSGQMLLQTNRIDIASIIRDAVATVKHAADAKRIRIEVALGDISGKFIGDQKRLQQVVWNLVSNAIKFTNNGGLVNVSATQSGSALEIVVKDNGRGISPQFLPFLFERFRQADASTTRRSGGLGIGLALVKQLVELHGGSVLANSEGLGRGSSFTVSLPFSAVADKQTGAESDTDIRKLENLTGLRVLFVDDDPNSVGIVKRILAGRNADVRSAGSVNEAMDILRAFSPHVVLSDIGMPGQDGYQFIRRLRESPSFAGVPAVALTALSRIEDRTRSLQAGFQTHIAKPVAAAELVAVVRSLGRLRVHQETLPPQQQS